MFMRRIRIPLAGVCLFLLTSCGGSGNSAAPPPPPPPVNTAALPITAANAQDITVSVFEAITSTVEIVSIVDVIGIPLLSNSIPGVQKPPADIFTEVIPCDTGQITVTWNDADNNLQISTADTFDVLFELCFIADAETTLDGAAALEGMVVVGDPFNQIAPWQLQTTFVFDGLSGTDVDGTVIVDGAIDLDMSSADNLTVNLAIGTMSLTVQEGGDSETLSEYSQNQTFDVNTLTQVINAGGVYTSTVLTGSVTFETTEDFVVIGDDNPSAGQMLISDTSSSVLVTVLDNISVQLDIDLNLNGTIDTTITVTWAELDIG